MNVQTITLILLLITISVRGYIMRKTTIEQVHIRSNRSPSSFGYRKINVIPIDVQLESTPYPGVNAIKTPSWLSSNQDLVLYSMSSMSAFFVADLFAQAIFLIANSSREFSLSRLIRFSLFGSLIYGPFGFLFRRFVCKAIPGDSLSSIFLRVRNAFICHLLSMIIMSMCIAIVRHI